jgi:NADH-quinone oxidoreductase subunit L
MTIPLVVLAALSILGGFMFVPFMHLNFFGEYLAPVLGKAEHHAPLIKEIGLMAVSLAAAVSGWLLARKFYYVSPEIPEKIASKLGRLYRLVLNKYEVDEAYDATVIKGTVGAALAMGNFDNAVIDGAVNRTASSTANIAHKGGIFDNEVVDWAVNGIGKSVKTLGEGARRIQTGNIRAYISSIAVGFIFVVAGFSVYYLRDDIYAWFGNIFRGNW